MGCQAKGQGQRGERCPVAGEKAGRERIILATNSLGRRVGGLFRGQKRVADVGWVVYFQPHGF